MTTINHFFNLLLARENVNSARRAIKKAFQNQVEGKGFSLIEVVSSCPTNWGMTPQKALRMTLAHVGKDELNLKRCVTGELSQAEYDLLVDFAYWRGSGGACRSEVVQAINRGDYLAQCEAYLNLDSRRATGKDCKQPGSGCPGVWVRAQERHRKCMEAQ